MSGAQVKQLPAWADTTLCLGLYAAVATVFVKLKLMAAAPTPFDPRGGDLLAYYYPMLKYGFAQLRSGQLPLWDPYQSCGAPFLAIPNIGLLYPLYLPYLFLDAATALNVDVILHLVIASWTMFLLCRHFHMGRGPSFIAGLVYAYSGSMLLKLYFPNFLIPVAWIPLIFLLVDDILWHRSWRSCAALAVVVGVTLLGGNVQFSYFTALALLPFVVVRSLLVIREQRLSALMAAGGVLTLAGTLAVLVAAVRVLPAAEYLRETWRPPGSLDIRAASMMAIPVRAFVVNLFTPGPPPPATSAWSGVDVQREVYVGVMPTALALLGLLWWTNRSVSLPIVIAGIASAGYAFGTATPFYALMFKLPGGNWFRGLDRALIIFAFSMAFLSGAGLEAMLRRARKVGGFDAPAKRITYLLPLVAGLVIVLLGVALGDGRGTKLLACYGGLMIAILGILCGFGSRMLVRTGGLVAVALLVVWDLFAAHRYPGVLPSQLDHYLSQYDSLFQRIRDKQGLDRTYIWSSMNRSAPLQFYSDVAKAGLMHGIWMVTDYEPLSGQRIESYLATLGPGVFSPIGYHSFRLSRRNVRLLDLMGVRYVVMQTGQEDKVIENAPEISTRWTLLSTEDGVSLYEHPDAMPRSFIVDHVEVESQADRLLARLEEVNLRQVALVEEAFDAEVTSGIRQVGAAAQVEITGYAPNHVTISADAPNGGFLVLTDQYYPGWRAFVDGVPTRIYRADYLFRGVRVPAGEHRVEFIYRPATFLAGALGSVIGVAGIILLLAMPHRCAERIVSRGVNSVPEANLVLMAHMRALRRARIACPVNFPFPAPLLCLPRNSDGCG